MSDSIPPLRRCTKCQQDFPATTEYFNRQQQGKFGLASRCKACQRAWSHENYEKRKVQPKNDPPDYKVCTNCGERLPIGAYNKSSISQDGYFPQCRECRKRYTPPYGGRQREYSARWYLENKTEVDQKHREYYRRNKLAAKVRYHTRRARIDGNGGKYSVRDIRLQLLAQTDKKGVARCWWCGEPLDDHPQIDHRIPITRGGKNEAGNLVLVHPYCNRSKFNKMPWEHNGRLL